MTTICGENFHGEYLKEPKCVNCKEKHRSTDKKCFIYVYNFNLKRLMADRNISIYEAMNIIKRPDTKKDAERRKAFPRVDEALIVL